MPRYLECLLEIKDTPDKVYNIGELFDNIITNSIKIAIKQTAHQQRNVHSSHKAGLREDSFNYGNQSPRPNFQR